MPELENLTAAQAKWLRDQIVEKKLEAPIEVLQGFNAIWEDYLNDWMEQHKGKDDLTDYIKISRRYKKQWYASKFVLNEWLKEHGDALNDYPKS